MEEGGFKTFDEETAVLRGMRTETKVRMQEVESAPPPFPKPEKHDPAGRVAAARSIVRTMLIRADCDSRPQRRGLARHHSRTD